MRIASAKLRPLIVFLMVLGLFANSGIGALAVPDSSSSPAASTEVPYIEEAPAAEDVPASNEVSGSEEVEAAAVSANVCVQLFLGGLLTPDGFVTVETLPELITAAANVGVFNLLDLTAVFNGECVGRVGPDPLPTLAPPTATLVPPTATLVPPTATTVPPTATTVPPTATSTDVPTATLVPPTATTVPPTATSVPPLIDVNICLTLFQNGLLNAQGLVVINPVSFLFQASQLQIATPLQLILILNGGCGGLVPPPTPTATLVPPTATATSTPTETPVPPTATATSTPVITPDPSTEGTVNVSKFYCSDITETVFQVGDVGAAAIPSSNGACQPGAATFSFYFIGDGTADFASLPIVGAGSIGLPAGNYEVVEEGIGARTLITVVDGGILNIVVSNPLEDALPTIPADQGTVNIAKFYCLGITETVFQAAPVGSIDVAASAGIPSSAGDCVAGEAVFTFYLVGDGTAEYAQLAVDGAGTIGIPAGDYEVVEESTQARGFITVTAGGVLSIVVTNPLFFPVVTPTPSCNVTPPPVVGFMQIDPCLTPTVTATTTPVITPDPSTEGTVNIAKFYCLGLDETVFQVGEVQGDAIPSSDGVCSPGPATFTFYFIGDGTDAYAQIDVDNTGTIGLPAGNYEVVEEGTGARTIITVSDGGILTMVVSNPTGSQFTPTPSDEGTVNIAKFYCYGLEETVFQGDYVNDVVSVAEDGGIPATAGECFAGYATFTFYLVGDGTDEYAQITVGGSGSIGLPAGDYEVVEEVTGARTFITVYEGSIYTLVVSNPFEFAPTVTPTTAPNVTPTSVPTHQPGPKPTHPAKPVVTKVATTATGSTVTSLPNTGQGAAGDNTDTILLLFGAMSVLLAAGAVLRQRRTR